MPKLTTLLFICVFVPSMSDMVASIALILAALRFLSLVVRRSLASLTDMVAAASMSMFPAG